MLVIPVANNSNSSIVGKPIDIGNSGNTGIQFNYASNCSKADIKSANNR